MRGSRAEGKLKQFLFRVAKSPNKSLPLGNGNCKHLPFLVSWLAGPLVATLITITETTGDRTRPDKDRWESRNLVFSVQGGEESQVCKLFPPLRVEHSHCTTSIGACSESLTSSAPLYHCCQCNAPAHLIEFVQFGPLTSLTVCPLFYLAGGSCNLFPRPPVLRYQTALLFLDEN